MPQTTHDVTNPPETNSLRHPSGAIAAAKNGHSEPHLEAESWLCPVEDDPASCNVPYAGRGGRPGSALVPSPFATDLPAKRDRQRQGSQVLCNSAWSRSRSGPRACLRPGSLRLPPAADRKNLNEQARKPHHAPFRHFGTQVSPALTVYSSTV